MKIRFGLSYRQRGGERTFWKYLYIGRYFWFGIQLTEKQFNNKYQNWKKWKRKIYNQLLK